MRIESSRSGSVEQVPDQAGQLVSLSLKTKDKRSLETRLAYARLLVQFPAPLSKNTEEKRKEEECKKIAKEKR